ncbi:hypothetical protein [Methylobacterium platani]|uniref:Uncharacterized protein n=2 Tax=Methylobacterium platani TaxID=427683 RepID=A0A179S237_9HYPH|nr:hypothetical protein [Methylobacterium platani]KMO21009.1 hypothetical protein SQ03_04375 [Methylobacterium platani JCM 14648]OAS19738.1 hypothetical protein A5481_24185 [Methylobacterium platani]
MWHSAVGFLAVATAVALIVRHFGAPRAVIVGFVITGLGASLATLLLADVNTVDPGESRAPAFTAQTAPVPGRDARDLRAWR